MAKLTTLLTSGPISSRSLLGRAIARGTRLLGTVPRALGAIPTGSLLCRPVAALSPLTCAISCGTLSIHSAVPCRSLPLRCTIASRSRRRGSIPLSTPTTLDSLTGQSTAMYNTNCRCPCHWQPLDHCCSTALSSVGPSC
jgi:hypothetical protein